MVGNTAAGGCQNCSRAICLAVVWVWCNTVAGFARRAGVQPGLPTPAAGHLKQPGSLCWTGSGRQALPLHYWSAAVSCVAVCYILDFRCWLTGSNLGESSESKHLLPMALHTAALVPGRNTKTVIKCRQTSSHS